MQARLPRQFTRQRQQLQAMQETRVAGAQPVPIVRKRSRCPDGTFRRAQQPVQVTETLRAQPGGEPGVERLGAFDERLVMAPDGVGGGAVTPIHVQKAVQLGQHVKGVRAPTHLPIHHVEMALRSRRPARQRVWALEQCLERAQHQGGLQCQYTRIGGRHGAILGRRSAHLAERRVQIHVLRTGVKPRNRGEPSLHEARFDLRPRMLRREPVQKAVMEIQIGFEAGALDARAAQHFEHPIEGLGAALAGGEQERDVAVVGTGQVIRHEQVCVWIVGANALIVTHLVGQCVGPSLDAAPGGRFERRVGGVEPHLDGVAVARHPARHRQLGAVVGDERHGFDEGIHTQRVGGIIGVGELQRITQFGDAMLHLDAGVHLHEVVIRAINDALEGGYGIQPHRFAEAGGFVLHFQQDVEIGLQGFRRVRPPGRSARGDFMAQGFLGDGRLHQLLLMHLRRAIAQPQRDAPIAVA